MRRQPARRLQVRRKKAIKDFEYLVGMPISTLTAEQVAELMKQRDLKVAELNALKKKTPADLWLHELEVLETELTKKDAAKKAEDEKERDKIQKAKSQQSQSGKGGGKRGVKRSASAGPGASTAKSGATKRSASEGPDGGGRAQKRKGA